MKIAEITTPLPLPATPELVTLAQHFVLRKWRERALERGAPEPIDLSNGCKFASLFAQKIFGGQLRGNWDHQYVILPNGQRLDLTEPSQNLADIQAAGRNPHAHDRRFWNNRDHRESMASCEPRVNQWVSQFLTEITVNETVMPRRLTLYHGTTPDAAKSLIERGWQPNQWGQGGNVGQTRYLYLTTGVEDAEWFANEKGASTVVEVRDIPVSVLIPDPEDAMGETVEDEITRAQGIGFPAKLALAHPLGPEHFRVVKV